MASEGPFQPKAFCDSMIPGLRAFSPSRTRASRPIQACCSAWRWMPLYSFRFSAVLNRMNSSQHLSHCQVLSLLLLFPGNLKTNYKEKNNNLQVFVRLHMKSSVSLTPTFSTRIFLCIIICIASGLPFLKY